MNKMSQEHIILLGKVVVAMATRKPELLALAISSCRKADISAEVLHEAIVQSYLFLGYPAALEALKIAAKDYDYLWRIPHNDVAESKAVLGHRVSQQVYGNALPKLLDNVGSLSPVLSRQMMEEGYGTVLCRSELSLGVREILIAVVLAETSYLTQLYSHVRGALRNGVTTLELNTVTQACCSPEAQHHVTTILEKQL